MLIALIGPPAAGKGTLAKLIQRDFPIFHQHLSIGDLLRQHSTQEYPTEHMAKGILANDQLVLRLIKEHLLNSKVNGALLDGFPRTLSQAQAIKAEELPIKLIINLEIDHSILYERISNRLVHKPSGRTYHKINSPPKIPMLDDITGEPLQVRLDDHMDAFENRLQDHHSIIPGIKECLQDVLWTTPSHFTSSADVYAHAVRPKLLSFLNRQPASNM